MSNRKLIVRTQVGPIKIQATLKYSKNLKRKNLIDVLSYPNAFDEFKAEAFRLAKDIEDKEALAALAVDVVNFDRFMAKQAKTQEEDHY